MENRIKVVAFVPPLNLLGKVCFITLKNGHEIFFKITGCGPEYFEGKDEEQMNLEIMFSDIDYIVGVGGGLS